MKVTTVRLPDDLDRSLTAYCARTGATRNRATVIALRSFLGDGPAPALPVQPPESAPDVAREEALLAAFRERFDAREFDPGEVG